MKNLLLGLFCAASIGALVHAQAPASAPFSPEVERHIEAARVAAGTEHAGLFDAVCTTARNVIAAGQRTAPRRRCRSWCGGPAGGPPAAPARETWYAEPVKVFDNLYFLGPDRVLGVGHHHLAGHHPARRHLRLLGRGRGRRRPEEAGARPGADQVRDGEPRPPRSRRRRQVPAGAVRRPAADERGRLRPDGSGQSVVETEARHGGDRRPAVDARRHDAHVLRHARPHRRHDLDDLPGARRQPAPRGGRVGRHPLQLRSRSGRGSSPTPIRRRGFATSPPRPAPT